MFLCRLFHTMVARPHFHAAVQGKLHAHIYSAPTPQLLPVHACWQCLEHQQRRTLHGAGRPK